MRAKTSKGVQSKTAENHCSFRLLHLPAHFFETPAHLLAQFQLFFRAQMQQARFPSECPRSFARSAKPSSTHGPINTCNLVQQPILYGFSLLQSDVCSSAQLSHAATQTCLFPHLRRNSHTRAMSSAFRRATRSPHLPCRSTFSAPSLRPIIATYPRKARLAALYYNLMSTLHVKVSFNTPCTYCNPCCYTMPRPPSTN